MQELRILHLEDDPFFADMVADLLTSQGMRFRVTRAADWPAFEAALHDHPYDLILSDHNIPGGDGLKALSLCRRECPNVPFIFLSGELGEERAVESLKSGAADYVLKTNISRLLPTVVRTLNAFRETAALRAAEARIRRDTANLHGLIENTTDAIWSMDLDFNILVFNSAASLLSMKMTGQPMVEGSCLLERLPAGMQEQWREAARRIRKRDRFVQEQELEWAGGNAIMEISFHPINSPKAVTGMALFARDVTERKRLLQAAQDMQEQRLRLVGLYKKMRVPLHGLMRLVGLLEKTPLDEGQQRHLALMGNNAERLADLHARAESYDAELDVTAGPWTKGSPLDKKAERKAEKERELGKPRPERRAEELRKLTERSEPT